jgi:outer membrane lipoprotein-sorting protein
MKYVKSFIAILFLFTLSVNVFSQTVDEVINNHVKAMGGLDKINAVKTVRFTGTFSGMGADIPVTITIKKQDMIKMDMSFQGMSFIQAYDGTTGWSINPFSGKKDAEKMPAEEVKDMKENAEWEGQLINYKDKGFKVELIGKEDMEGSEAYKIKLTDKDSDVTYYFLDATTYLVIKQSAKRKFKEKEITQEQYPGNYQAVEGIMFPMSVEIKTAGQDQSQKGTFTKVELNVDVDDAIFKMPEGTK